MGLRLPGLKQEAQPELFNVNIWHLDKEIIMGRVLIRKSDGFPVEFQSGNAPLGTLKQNAANSGFNPDEYDERYMSDGDYYVLLKNKTVLSEDEVSEKKIKDEIESIQRSEAIASLKSKGELPNDYKDKKIK